MFENKKLFLEKIKNAAKDLAAFLSSKPDKYKNFIVSVGFDNSSPDKSDFAAIFSIEEVLETSEYLTSGVFSVNISCFCDVVDIEDGVKIHKNVDEIVSFADDVSVSILSSSETHDFSLLSCSFESDTNSYPGYSVGSLSFTVSF